MGVCMRDVNNDISNFNLSDCILGLNAHFKNTSDCEIMAEVTKIEKILVRDQ